MVRKNSKVATTTKVENTKRGNNHNPFDDRDNLVNDVVDDGGVYVQSFSSKRRRQPPWPQLLAQLLKRPPCTLLLHQINIVSIDQKGLKFCLVFGGFCLVCACGERVCEVGFICVESKEM